MKKYLSALFIFALLVAHLGAPQPVSALTLTNAVSTPLTSPEGSMDVRAYRDYVGIAGAYTAPGVITTFTTIPTVRIRYDALNAVTSGAGITKFTIYYDPSVAPYIKAVQVPLGYITPTGTLVSLGGVSYVTLLNAGYATYYYNTGSPWKIEYAADHISFISVTATAPALPGGCAVGATDLGYESPVFTLQADPSLTMTLVEASATHTDSLVLLKGFIPGPSLTARADTDIAGAKGLPDGKEVYVAEPVATGLFSSAPYFYVEEQKRFQGIRVRSKVMPTDINRFVKVDGLMNTVDGEKEILALDIYDGGAAPSLAPLLMPNKALGGGQSGLQAAVPPGKKGVTNVGLLVKTTGRVTAHDSGGFYIDDGSHLTDTGYVGLKVKSANSIGVLPPVGSMVAVTGESGAEINARTGLNIRVLRPRSADDVQVLRRPVAFVYSSDLTTASAFKGMLDSSGFPTTILSVTDAETADLSQFTAVIIGSDTGGGAFWGTPAAVTHINGSGLPILGLGDGGYAFFGKLSLAIGYGLGWTNFESTVYAMNPASSIYTTPNPITVPVSREISLFTSAVSEEAIYVTGSTPAGVELIGAELPLSDHYSIIRQNSRYLLWGFGAGPGQMTSDGKHLFINALIYNYQ